MGTHVIAVINQKGGAGKTTLSMNLAAGLSRRADTVVIDLDPQGSSRQWATMGSQPFPASWLAIVHDGVLKDNGMASFAESLSKEEMDAIREYVIRRANEDKAIEGAGGGAEPVAVR